MKFSACYPYRSEAARESFLAHYDSVLVKEWPVVSEERMVPTSFGQTFVRITGPATAPPLVLLSGACATSLMWAPNIQALSAAYRTVAVDRIADVGRTICTKGVQDPDDHVVWLNELFDALELGDRINLAGVSFGGWLTALYAVRFPARLNKAVLIAPGGTVRRFSAKFLAHIGWGATRRGSTVAAILRWVFADLARKDPKRFDEIVERMEIAGGAIDPRNILRPTVFTDAELRNLRVPTLFLAGEHETMYSMDKAVRRLKKVAPQIKVEIVAGAGHDLTLVQTDTVNRAILDFLAEEPAASEASGTGAR